MADMTPLTSELIQWAKRHARAEERFHLVVDDFVVGAYAMLQEDKLTLADLSAESQPETMKWPDSILPHYRKTLEVPPVGELFKFDDSVRTLVERVHTESTCFDHKVLLGHLMKLNSPLLCELRQVNDTTPRKLAVAGLDALMVKAQSLRTGLAQEVFGQDKAISMMSDAYFRACLAPAPGGPRGIFTFMGPPGVGKTLLAQTFARVLSKIEGRDIPLLRLDMSTYAAHQNHEALYGFPKGYSNARPGVLTGFVKEHPECVVLLDEIEKAHENTLHSLLAMLDKGEVKDQHLDEIVPFRSCWVIATTNLGHSVLSQSNRSGVLGASATASEFAFDVLGSAGRRQPAGGMPNMNPEPTLSPEFVSRLAQGGAVVFGDLDADELLRLVERSMARQIEQVRLDGDNPGVQLDVSPEARMLFLQSLLPEVDARKVVARSSRWAIDLLRDSWETCSDLVGGLDAGTTDGTYKISVRAEDEVQKELSGRLPDNRLRLLLIDEDDTVASMVAAADGIGTIVTRKVQKPGEVMAAARSLNPDLVMLDLSINVSCGDAPEAALGILNDLRTGLPDVPVFLFADRDCAGMDLNRLIEQILSRGGARGLIPFNRGVTDPVATQDATARVRQALTQTFNDKAVRHLTRSRLATRFDIDWEAKPKTTEVTGSIRRVRRTVVISVADQGSAISFSGIPTETFAQVIGLTRAKRRLGQVLQWLKDPAALAKFGVSLPRGFLLAGPPGTGKTLLARALAGEAGLPFLALSAGELQSKWFGEDAARVRELFDKARKYAPAIIFIDEIDSIASDRSEQDQNPQREILNQLLASMDGFNQSASPIFVLAATNHPDALDPAIRRPGRFDETIPVDLPNAQARREFFAMRLRTLGMDGVDPSPLVAGTSGMTPAQLDRIVRESAYGAAAAGRTELTMDDLQAARRLVRFGARDEDARVNDEELRGTAIHESGHALAHLILRPARKIDYLTVLPTEGGVLGFLAPEAAEDKNVSTRADIEADVMISLAGREAEAILLGEDNVSNGASNDLMRATAYLSRAIGDWGMDPDWGLLSLSGLPNGHRGVDLSKAVKAWLENLKDMTRAMLSLNAAALKDLSRMLQEKEALEWAELEAFTASHELEKPGQKELFT